MLELLTPTELRVTEMIAFGLQRKHIAYALGISIYTVGSHVLHIYEKLKITNQVQLALIYHGVDYADKAKEYKNATSTGVAVVRESGRERIDVEGNCGDFRVRSFDVV